MTPPPSLGTAFANVIAKILTWDPGKVAHIDNLADRSDGIVGGVFGDAAERIDAALWASGVGQWPRPDTDEASGPWPAGPYLDTLRLNGAIGPSVVAAAVLARDLGLTTSADFIATTTWWVEAELHLPEANPGARFAADQAVVASNAAAISAYRHQLPGWPMAVVERNLLPAGEAGGAE